MRIPRFVLVGAVLCLGVTSVIAQDPYTDKAVDALIAVIGDKDASNGDKLEDTNRAIRALSALGKRAVPKLLDTIVSTNGYAAAYGGHALKEMMPVEVHDLIKERWSKVGDAEKWKLIYHFNRFDFDAACRFAVAGLEHKDETLRGQAWDYVVKYHSSIAIKPARERYLKALAGDDMPKLRWGLLTEKPMFDAEKEADILISLLRPDAWTVKGEGRIYCCHTPPWWPDGRDLVVTALGARKVKRAAPALINVLAEKGPGRAYLGHLIIPLLGDFGDKEAIPELKRILKTPGKDQEYSLWGLEYNQGLAAKALWQLGDQSGRPMMQILLKSSKWGDRRFAAETIGKLGDKNDIETLGSVLDDEDWGVLRFACQGLERITGVQNRALGWTYTGEYDAPLWKAYLKKK
ncbi:MAG: HEAT repeat domain-containing protein [Gemmataceae bacterium]|nr:HEAT repeat domain-containing protein [Gemmataceae bacterium]MCI0741430.1 HEAT repeat domain-containing protein [Gemmataceae bacterium]